MPLRLAIYLTLSVLAIMMIELKSQEKLSLDDGTRSATVLPLDKKSSKRKYETATFGLG